MELKYIPLDIETTGIHPLETELVSWVLGSEAIIQKKDTNEEEIIEWLAASANNMNKSTTTIITFMGGTVYSPGFDFPYLRTKFLKYGILWPFKGFNHIDLFPIIQKWFDMDFSELGTIDDLDAAGLKKLVIHFGLKPESNMKLNIAQTNEFVEQDQIDKYLADIGLMKNKTHSGLKDACIHLLGTKDDGMRGEKVPGMFNEWKETGDDSILTKILDYNQADCDKTIALFEAVYGMVPNRILSGELL